MASKRRILIKIEDQYFCVARIARTANATVVWLPMFFALNHQAVRDVHLTLSHATYKYHVTVVLDDGAKIAVYEDAYRVSSGSEHGLAYNKIVEELRASLDFVRIPVGKQGNFAILSYGNNSAWIPEVVKATRFKSQDLLLPADPSGVGFLSLVIFELRVDFYPQIRLLEHMAETKVLQELRGAVVDGKQLVVRSSWPNSQADDLKG